MPLDPLGHASGDILLKELADQIRNSLRSVDLVGRFGGDEILILLPDAGFAEACKVAERLRTQVLQVGFQAAAGSIQMSLSLGIAEIELEKDHSLDNLIHRADNALYAAKRGGGNRAICLEFPSEGALISFREAISE
ncbi:MAG: GGDEF domain-containing protein [Pseudomonadota bacterium]